VNLFLTLAQTTVETGTSVTAAPTTGGTPPPGWFQLLQGPLFPLMVGVLILYLFVFRSKRQTDKKRTDMLSNLKRGDKVQTIGGILGTVVEARDSDVLLKVDESSNTKIRFSRNAIHRVVEEEKAAETK
jgi:preprotein translocase subunit YajC